MEWKRSFTRLSLNNAVKEFSIKEVEILEAIKAGKLQYKLNYAHGNPYYKLIRSEIESLGQNKYGNSFLEEQKRKTELEIINKQLRKYRNEIKLLEKRKSELERN